jgi:hypothetical protein
MAVEGGDRTISDADRSEFTELRITEAPPATIVVAEVLDASQLRGIIAQLQLHIRSVRPPGPGVDDADQTTTPTTALEEGPTMADSTPSPGTGGGQRHAAAPGPIDPIGQVAIPGLPPAYLRLLLLAAVLGVPVSAAAYYFL